jgi:SRSO17 transposase
VPPERRFASKVELGHQLIERVRAGPLRFACVCCDALYGQSEWFRARLDRDGVRYMADVPRNTQVYLEPPWLPPQTRGRKRKAVPRPETWRGEHLRVEQWAARDDVPWQQLTVRPTERGELVGEFAARRIWTLREGTPAEEWLVVRRDADGRRRYALSNAPADTPLSELARQQCGRYFVERTHQEAKSDLGWDELQAWTYPAWEHHLALTILASWFVARTKWEWGQEYARDPQLLAEWELTVLPALSIGNVRTLLRATLPLPQLTPEGATELVLQHLTNRTRARRSRLKRARAHSPP